MFLFRLVTCGAVFTGIYVDGLIAVGHVYFMPSIDIHLPDAKEPIPTLVFYPAEEDGLVSGNYIASVPKGDRNPIQITYYRGGDEQISLFDFVGVSKDLNHLRFRRRPVGEEAVPKCTPFPIEKFINLVNTGKVALKMGDDWTDVRDIQRDGLKYGNDGAYYAEISFVKYTDMELSKAAGDSVFQYSFYDSATVYIRKGGKEDEKETIVLNDAAKRKWPNRRGKLGLGRPEPFGTDEEFKTAVATKLYGGWLDLDDYHLIHFRKWRLKHRVAVIEDLQWVRLTQESDFPDGSIAAIVKKGNEIDAVYKAKVYYKDNSKGLSKIQGQSRRLTEEFKADTGNDESGSTQNGFGWLVTVTTIITVAMIGFSFYLFAPMRAVRM